MMNRFSLKSMAVGMFLGAAFVGLLGAGLWSPGAGTPSAVVQQKINQQKNGYMKVVGEVLFGDVAFVKVESYSHERPVVTSAIECNKVDGVWKIGYRVNKCLSNLKQIMDACWQSKMSGEEVTNVSDLCGRDRYIKTVPVCPCGASYTFTTDAEGFLVPVCTSGIEGHKLP